jgi:hypothetical protein
MRKKEREKGERKKEREKGERREGRRRRRSAPLPQCPQTIDALIESPQSCVLPLAGGSSVAQSEEAQSVHEPAVPV